MTITIFDELLDDVAEELGSKKDEITYVENDNKEDTQDDRSNDSTQSEETRSVEVSRAGSGGQSTGVAGTSRTDLRRDTYMGREVYQSRETKRERVEETNQDQVQVPTGNEKDEVDRPQDNGVEDKVDWLPIGEMPVKDKRLNLTRTRKKDKLRNDRSGLFGSTPIEFAVDSEVAKLVFTSRSLGKTRWGVTGCVLLRDQGVCQVCGDSVVGEFKVVQIIPNSSGYGFTEPNCITVCEQCSTCWKLAYDVSFYDEGRNEYGRVKHKLSILTRRLKGYHGCKTLNDIGLAVRKSLLVQKDKIESELEDARIKLIKEVKNYQEPEDDEEV